MFALVRAPCNCTSTRTCPVAAAPPVCATPLAETHRAPARPSCGGVSTLCPASYHIHLVRSHKFVSCYPFQHLLVSRASHWHPLGRQLCQAETALILKRRRDRTPDPSDVLSLVAQWYAWDRRGLWEFAYMTFRPWCPTPQPRALPVLSESSIGLNLNPTRRLTAEQALSYP
jgi:hypothetical protein